jgi:hypothetical protein
MSPLGLATQADIPQAAHEDDLEIHVIQEFGQE